MATTAKIAKELKKPKFKIRLRNRCKLCGRPRGYLGKFKLCRQGDFHSRRPFSILQRLSNRKKNVTCDP